MNSHADPVGSVKRVHEVLLEDWLDLVPIVGWGIGEFVKATG